MVDTLPDRIALAASQNMPFEDLLALVLTDEIARRDTTAVSNRVDAAKLDPDMCIERFDKSAKITFDRKLFNELCSLRFLQAHKHVVILGPVGVGKTFIASAFGHIAWAPQPRQVYTSNARMLVRKYTDGVGGHRADTAVKSGAWYRAMGRSVGLCRVRALGSIHK